jgi:hypothetical protein
MMRHAAAALLACARSTASSSWASPPSCVNDVLITSDEGQRGGKGIATVPFFGHVPAIGGGFASSTCLYFASLHRSPFYSLSSSSLVLSSTVHLLPLPSPSSVRRLRSSTEEVDATRSPIRSLPPLRLPFQSLLLPPSPIPLSSLLLYRLLLLLLPTSPPSLPLPHLLTSFRSLTPPSPGTPRQRGRGRPRARDTLALDRMHDPAGPRALYEAVSEAGEFFSCFVSWSFCLPWIEAYPVPQRGDCTGGIRALRRTGYPTRRTPVPHTPHLRAIIDLPHLYLAESKATAPRGTRAGIDGLRAGLMVRRRCSTRRWERRRRDELTPTLPLRFSRPCPSRRL